MKTTALALVALLAVLPAAAEPAPALGRPYLALFTFQSAELQSLTDEQLRLLEKSPYDGMAVWFVKADGTQPAPDLDAMQARLAHVRQVTKKHLWPFVFFNRILQSSADAQHHAEMKPNPAFAGIRGMDLDDETGALSAFLTNWRRSLQIARALKSPGIGLDPEFYNDYNLESLATLAKRRGETEGETLAKLRALGTRMAGLVREEYPRAVVWCAFTRLGASPEKIAGVPGHILQGLLDRARTAKIPLKLVDGGEDSIGYVHGSVEELAEKIRKRRADWRQRTATDPALVLGGTIAPWLDAQHRAYWMTDPSAITSIEEFEPLLTVLLQRLPFVWVYGAGNAYNVWEPRYAERFHPVLAAAKKTAGRGRADR